NDATNNDLAHRRAHRIRWRRLSGNSERTASAEMFEGRGQSRHRPGAVHRSARSAGRASAAGSCASLQAGAVARPVDLGAQLRAPATGDVKRSVRGLRVTGTPSSRTVTRAGGSPTHGKDHALFPVNKRALVRSGAELRGPATGDVSRLKKDVEGDRDQNEHESEDHGLILGPAEMLPPPVENADIHGRISLKC